METRDTDRQVVILNPVSGSGDHVEAVRNRASIRGYEVRKTEEAGDAPRFARQAAEEGASLIAAAGGDGTLNQVVQGVRQADAFDEVTVAVIPAGTGNNFAKNIGITSIADGFAAIEEGERRRIDLGLANDRPFVNSCIGGLTAEASGDTTAELKNRLGVLAYVVTTLRSVGSFESLRLEVEAVEAGNQPSRLSREAICVLVGNGRRFSFEGSQQANMEDGLLEVTIVEDVPKVDLMSDAVGERLFGRSAENTTRLLASEVKLRVDNPEPISFSMDGEMDRYERLTLDVDRQTLEIPVGDAYKPNPDA